MKSILIIAILSSLLSVGYAGNILKYDLTRVKVKRAWIAETSSGYLVAVELKEHYRKGLADLAGHNIGDRLEIVFAGKVLRGETIWHRNDFALINAGEWSSKEEARKFIKTLSPDIEIIEKGAEKIITELRYLDKHLVYEITGEKVKRAWITETSSGHYITVELKKPYREEFAELTGNNVGRRLEIVFAGQVLEVMKIWDRYELRFISAGEWSSKEEVRKFVEAMSPDVEITERVKEKIIPEVRYVDGKVRYELTREKVKRAWITETSSGYYVDVELKGPYIKEFTELTMINFRKRLEVILSGEILTAATIVMGFPYGLITSSRKWNLEEEARKFVETALPDIEVKELVEGTIPDDEYPETPEMEKTVIKDFVHWFITRGIAGYYRDGDFRKIKDYERERGILVSVHDQEVISSAPPPKEHRFLLRINVVDKPVEPVSPMEERHFFWKFFHIYVHNYWSQVALINRIQHDDKYYELWYVNLEGYNRESVYEGKITGFYVAETGRLTEERRIIFRSDKFFSELSLKDGTKIKFPHISLWSLAYLDPDSFPESFKGTIFDKLTARDVVKSHKKIDSIAEVDEDFKDIIYDYTRWIITKGVAGYYKDKDIEKLRDQLLKEKGAGLLQVRDLTYTHMLLFFAMPYEPKSGSFSCFHLQQRVYGTPIGLLDRIEHENRLYEFWFVYIYGPRPCQDIRERGWGTYSIKFFVTETEGLTMDRKIIVESDKFFREFSLPDGTKLSFPPVKISSIHILNPWYSEEAFKGTELEGIYENDLVKLP